MSKDEILQELERIGSEEEVSKLKRSILSEWWAILYGVNPPRNKIRTQLAYDICHMVRARNRAQALARGLNH